MIFNNLLSSLFSNAKQSLHLTNLHQNPLTLIKSLLSHGKNRKLATGRMFDRYSFALSNGIKPVPQPLTNNLIRTRLETEHERLINMRKELQSTKSELKLARYLRERQKKIARDVEKASTDKRLIQMEEHRKELKNMEKKLEHWQGIANQHQEKIFKMDEDVHTLTEAALTSANNFETLRAERDETRALLAREKERAEATERHCKETVSSLRQSWEQEKELLKCELKDLRETARNKDHKIAELNEFCEENMREMEDKDRQIALHEGNEAMGSFSHGMSCILSEMSEVVLFGQKDWPNLGDKMKTLYDAMKELVREVKIRREHSHIASLRIYILEQEKEKGW